MVRRRVGTGGRTSTGGAIGLADAAASVEFLRIYNTRFPLLFPTTAVAINERLALNEDK